MIDSQKPTLDWRQILQKDCSPPFTVNFVLLAFLKAIGLSYFVHFHYFFNTSVQALHSTSMSQDERIQSILLHVTILLLYYFTIKNCKDCNRLLLTISF